MRYQYLSLVYMLRHRSFASMTMNPNIFEEHSPSFDNFNVFYQFTKDMLAPLEECDCFRNHYTEWVSNSFENRYYRDAANNITVTYLWYIYYGHGHWTFEQSLNKDITKNYPHIDLSPAAETWKYTFCNISSMYLGTFDPKPDVILFNVGRWGQQLSDEDAACAVFDMLQVSNIVIWKTTTYAHTEANSGVQGLHINENNERIKPYEGTALAIMNTSWTGELKDLKYFNYGDDNHYTANVYNLLNIQFMEVIEARRKELEDAARNMKLFALE